MPVLGGLKLAVTYTGGVSHADVRTPERGLIGDGTGAGLHIRFVDAEIQFIQRPCLSWLNAQARTGVDAGSTGRRQFLVRLAEH